jgi:2-keto-4-pentenoate hydratase/2-oxohepta-3-ene-1,7-dioic acid hydratase in catechol pathway
VKIVRFLYKGEEYKGRVESGSVRGSLHGGKERAFGFDEIKLLPPVRPSKIVCVGLNYIDHAEELGMAVPEEPVIFLKPVSSLIGPYDRIIHPLASERVDFEGELAVVIGKEARRVYPLDAKEYILGYSCFNDVTARDLQKKDGQWTRSKSYDTFAPLGPCIETDIGPEDLEIKTLLNGKIRQFSRTSNLIFSIEELVSFISGVMTLFPGDVIATGTPGGIGPMRIGDKVVVKIEGVGELENSVFQDDHLAIPNHNGFG